MRTLTIIIGNKNYSSWSLRGWLAAKHTGMPLQEILLQLDTPSFYAEIEKYNPAKKVPTLIDGNIRVWDSAAIIDYCALIAPEKFWWPKDRDAYALARSVSAEMHSGFSHVRNHLPMNLRKDWAGNFGKGVLKDIQRIDTIWTECRTRFGQNGQFLFGSFSGADIMYAPVVARFLSYHVPVSATAKAYMDAVRAHPTMVAWYAAAALETEIVPMDEIDPTAKTLG